MEEKMNSQPPSTMSVALRFGLIMGLFSVAYTVIVIAVGGNPLESDWKGWVSLAVSAVIVVFAHKNFKDNGDGFMSYGQGLGIAFLSVLISGVISGIFLFVYINFIDTGVMEDLMQKTSQKMEEQGQSEEAIEMALSFTKKFFWAFYAFGLVFGSLIIGLVISIFTQKKNPEPFA